MRSEQGPNEEASVCVHTDFSGPGEGEPVQRPRGRPSLVWETGSRPVWLDLGPRELGGAFRAQSGGAVSAGRLGSFCDPGEMLGA